MQLIHVPFKRRWRYIAAGILIFGMLATLLVTALNIPGTNHKAPTKATSQASSTGIAKVISQGRLEWAGSIITARLPTGSKGTHPYSSGSSISPNVRRAAQRAITDPQVPGVTPGHGAFSVISGDQHAPGLVQSFEGVNAVQDLYVTGYDNDPPDQGLCVSPAFVVEEVNFAMTIYFHDGSAALPPISLNDFFRESPNEYIFDPRCYFDPSSASWFTTLAATDPNGQHSHLDLAVSSGIDPTDAWTVYRIDTTDATRPTCPCFPDNPRLAMDAFGVYVTQNEFNMTNAPLTFYGSQIYAISKSQLVALQPAPYFVHYGGLAIGGMIADALQPALNQSKAPAELFMGSLYRGLATSHRLGVWALTNQARLDTNSIPTLSSVLIQSEVYSHPPLAIQNGSKAPLNTDDDRMDDVVYSGGMLWGSLYSGVHVAGDTVNRSGIAWFAVWPKVDQNLLTQARIEDQGYIAVKGEYLLSGTIAVNQNGTGAMVMTLVGPDYFPGVVYTTFRADGETRNFSPLHLVSAGTRPASFGSCLPQNGGVCTWGDYSATAIDNLDGSIWLAAEYIPGEPAIRYENWGTRILDISPTA